MAFSDIIFTAFGLRIKKTDICLKIIFVYLSSRHLNYRIRSVSFFI